LVLSSEQKVARFGEFFAGIEPKLRHALVAHCGPEVGREAAADALEYAWAHWNRVEAMEYPVAYLYRVGQSAAKRYRRGTPVADPSEQDQQPWFEPVLLPALARLSDRQRTAVVLRHGFGYTYPEISEVMGVSIPTVQKHIDRALAKLRRSLEVGSW
jgi:RNA polymerase sigma factor (sigma-70 family)